jgi:hypothetical protein
MQQPVVQQTVVQRPRDESGSIRRRRRLASQHPATPQNDLQHRPATTKLATHYALQPNENSGDLWE